MKDKTVSKFGQRMIHVRLNELTHKRLKMLTVREDSTIQGIVEELIERRLAEEQTETKRAERGGLV